MFKRWPTRALLVRFAVADLAKPQVQGSDPYSTSQFQMGRQPLTEWGSDPNSGGNVR